MSAEELRHISFIHNNINVNDFHELQLSSEIVFRKPTPRELKDIQWHLEAFRHKLFNDHTFMPPNYNPYENHIDIRPIKIIKESVEDWRYWVFDCGKLGLDFQFRQICRLGEVELELGLQIIYHSDEFFMAGIDDADYLQKNMFHRSDILIQRFAPAISINKIKHLGDYYIKLKQLPDKYFFVIWALQNYDALKYISNNHRILFVGLVSIIESLIVHESREKGGISRQVQSKMNLLWEMFPRKINYQDYFDISKCTKCPYRKKECPCRKFTSPEQFEEEIWKSVYMLRNKIAHGNEFDRGKLLCLLESRGKLEDFLREVIKNIIILSLDNPKFVYDLKKC